MTMRQRESIVDAALAGLRGTTVGAAAGFAGAWLTQRNQLRLQREQRAHDERVRWLDDKRTLYRDLLIAMYGWHDALVSIWRNQGAEKLFGSREAAYKWSVEANLIASGPVRSAIHDLYDRFYKIQPGILNRAGSEDPDDPPVAEVLEGLGRLEDALRAELAEPGRSDKATARGRFVRLARLAANEPASGT